MVELKNEMIQSPSKKANVEGVKAEASSLAVESSSPVKNLVLQKLLRAPRYFDWPKRSSSCSSSDEEYLTKKRRKRQKVCHYCGDNNHVTTDCEQIKHMLGVPDNDSDVDGTSSVLCLKCGETGHEMFSCSNGYDSSDLQEVRCYVCNEKGHLCCGNYETEQQVAIISCYNCGQSGHIGHECPEPKEATLCSNSKLGDQSLQESSKSPEENLAMPARSGRTARRARNRKKKKAAKRLAEAAELSVRDREKKEEIV